MRRRRFLAALGAAGVVSACAIFVGAAIVAAVPRDGPAKPHDEAIPGDLVWAWLLTCMDAQESVLASTSLLYGYSIDGEGAIDAHYGNVDADGTLTRDDEMSAVMNACVQTRRAEVVGGGRPMTDADRLIQYDWAVRRQQPCLSLRGIDTDVPTAAAFFNAQSDSTYGLDQYLYSGPGAPRDFDFDTVLAARLACPPVPRYLALELGW